MESNKNLISWLKSNYPIEVYESKQHTIVLVYTKSDYKFDELIPEEFYDLKIQYHYPEIVIMPNHETYLPNVTKYDPAVEFITLKIMK